MPQEGNPLDRISSGPSPTGPNPWRSDRLPTGSPYAGSRSGGRRRGPLRLGPKGLLTLVVAIALIAGAIGWAAVSERRSDTGVLLGGPPPTANAPEAPSLQQVAGSPVFETALLTPTGCALPPWSVQADRMQAFAQAATRCMKVQWSMRPYRVEVFATADDVVPGTVCSPGWRIRSISSCSDTTFINGPRLSAASGSQAGGALQWLALIVAGRAAGLAGQNTDVDALVRVSGGENSTVGLDLLRRKHLQDLCVSGAVVAKLVGNAITATDRDQAAETAASWSVLGRPEGARLASANARAWFDRGSLSPSQAVCRTVWSAPVEQVS